jgi:hypothetical protein
MRHKVSKKFPVGDRVVKNMGCRMEGTVIPPFSHKEADDGTYRPPLTRDKPVWVRWSDGSRGWINEVHVTRQEHPHGQV